MGQIAAIEGDMDAVRVLQYKCGYILTPIGLMQFKLFHAMPSHW